MMIRKQAISFDHRALIIATKRKTVGGRLSHQSIHLSIPLKVKGLYQALGHA
jgi:hypothetical protein